MIFIIQQLCYILCNGFLLKSVNQICKIIDNATVTVFPSYILPSLHQRMQYLTLCNNHRTLKLQGSPGARLYRPGEGRGYPEPVLERVPPSHLDHRVRLAGMKYICERPVAEFIDP